MLKRFRVHHRQLSQLKKVNTVVLNPMHQVELRPYHTTRRLYSVPSHVVNSNVNLEEVTDESIKVFNNILKFMYSNNVPSAYSQVSHWYENIFMKSYGVIDENSFLSRDDASFKVYDPITIIVLSFYFELLSSYDQNTDTHKRCLIFGRVAMEQVMSYLDNFDQFQSYEFISQKTLEERRNRMMLLLTHFHYGSRKSPHYDAEKAVQYIRQLNEYEPGNSTTLMLGALTSAAVHNLNDLDSYTSELLTQHPDDASLTRTLAQCYAEIPTKKADTHARKLFEKSIQQQKDDGTIDEYAIYLLYKIKDINAAKTLLDTYIEEFSTSPHLLSKIGLVYYELEDDEKALEYLSRAKETNYVTMDVVIKLGILEYRQNRYSKAIELFKSVREKISMANDIELNYFLYYAESLFKTDKVKIGQSVLKEALTYYPENEKVLQMMESNKLEE